ncbi:MAG: heterodisulfide reductase-related iron-sulfur binding cluster [Ferrimicrobium sp.]
MTTTYNPSDPAYFDEVDLRGEIDRVFELCHGCRMCFNYCGSFPTLFGFIDGRDQQHAELSHAEQDLVVDECFQCKICYVKCPYTPPHEWMLDFPRLMMRANAVRVSSGSRSFKEKVTDQVLAQTDLVGRVSSAMAPLANRFVTRPKTRIRRVMEQLSGVSAVRVLPPYSKVRFSRWFRDRLPRLIAYPKASASIFPSCFVEYMEPRIGADLVSVLEHNDVSCSLPEGVQCCGAPWLHQGNVADFMRRAARNVAALTAVIDADSDVVVSQPTCAYVIKRDYPLYLGTEAARRVAARTFDASEYLMKIHRECGGIDTTAVIEVPTVAYHAACHLQAQNVGLKGRDLIKTTGATVTVVARCSGIDGTWGYRAENQDTSKKMALRLADQLVRTKAEVLVGDCHLANTAVYEELERGVEHPVSLFARITGVAPEPSLASGPVTRGEQR